MSVNIGRYSNDAIASPFDAIDYDINTQTGGDWYTTMLSASLGNKNIEGIACSGSSEVLMKSTFKFASKHATGKIRIKTRNKATPAVDKEGKMVAKLGKKFRGVGKANSFSLVMEDSLWGSASMNRVRSAAFFSASLVAMGVSLATAREVGGDVLGESMPIEVVNSVSVPLSILKRDAAVIAKGRNTVFVPHHLIQDVVWEDGALVTSEKDSHAAVDWGRVTAIARYIGVVNSLADDRFARFAEDYGVPYALVNNHWAYVSKEPYLELEKWVPLEHPENPLGSVIDDAQRIAERLSTSAQLSVSMIADLQETPTATLLLKSLRAAAPSKTKPRLMIADGSDVLLPVMAHSVNPGNVGILVQGSESSHNAVISAVIDRASRNETVKERLSRLLTLSTAFNPDEGEVRSVTKEIADKIIDARIFTDARARLGSSLGDDAIAERRVATYRRSMFRNSSALSDRVCINDSSIDTLTNVFMRVARAVISGNTGALLPPPILANPEAAIRSGETIKLLQQASEYLQEATEYWATRYQTQATAYSKSDKTLSVHYGMASKAFKKLRAEWLVEWENSFLPSNCLDESYIRLAVRSYTRKRPNDHVKTAPMANESAIAYARRMDVLLQPTVTFTSSVEFVNSKVAMLAEDFMSYRVFTEPKVTDPPKAETSPVRTIPVMPQLDFLNVVPNLKKVTSLALRGTWFENGDPDAAARANGYISYGKACGELGDKCAFDPENEFTKRYLRARAAEEEEAVTAATEQVI